VSAVLEIVIDDELELSDYLFNLRRIYGEQTMDAVVGSVDGSVRFYGLTPTNMQLEGLDKHLRLVESYKKLHAARAARV
jgi:ribosomal protein S12 methylthiotransferase accessory factor